MLVTSKQMPSGLNSMPPPLGVDSLLESIQQNYLKIKLLYHGPVAETIRYRTK
jgi:hypothetical protein